jgi:hypothetical protein
MPGSHYTATRQNPVARGHVARGDNAAIMFAEWKPARGSGRSVDTVQAITGGDETPCVSSEDTDEMQHGSYLLRLLIFREGSIFAGK